MNQQSREKLIAAGFQVYRKSEVIKDITCYSQKGGWMTVDRFSTLRALNQAWARLMKDPMAIDD